MTGFAAPLNGYAFFYFIARTKLKAVLCESFGPAENLTLGDIPSPELKPGHVRVDIRACALNFPDVLIVEGSTNPAALSLHAGGEFAGVICEIADDVSKWQVGDGVLLLLPWRYGRDLRACRSITQNQKADIPNRAGISTTWYLLLALKQRANLQPGETLLAPEQLV